nr:DUF3141 domain-containing protein [Rhizobium leguminosarum]
MRAGTHFTAAARLSEINLANYRVVAQPAVRATVTLPVAEAMGHLHPLRLGYESHPGAGRLTLAEFKTMMREQYFVLLNDEPGVLAAIPALLLAGHRRAPKGLRGPARGAGVVGAFEAAAADRLEHVAELLSFGNEEFGNNQVREPASKTARVRKAS